MKKTKTIFNNAEILTSLIYLCAISAALMYVLCKDHAFVCTLIMTAVSFGIFALFYTLRQRKLLSLLAFVGMFILVDLVCSGVSAAQRSPSFMQFIFTSSDFFNPFFAAAAILLFSAIIGFTTSYFTVYTPRPCFLLLPAFIPLILAARTTSGLPAGLIIFMAVGFFSAALGIARPEKPGENIYIDDNKARLERLAAIALLTGGALVLMIIVPRVENTKYSQYLDSVFTHRNRNFYGNQTLAELNTTALPNTGNNTLGTSTLFVAATTSPANVASGSYDIYEQEKGWRWLEDPAVLTGYSNWEDGQRAINCSQLINELKQAAADGKLLEYKNDIDRLTVDANYSATMMITVVDGSNTAVVLHPQRTYSAVINNYSDYTYRNRKDEIFTEDPFGKNAAYSLMYYTEQPNESFLEMLERVDLEQLLGAAFDEGVITAAEYNNFLYQDDNARQYQYLVDRSGITPEIRTLAEEITEGLTNNYQKARAIEEWFGEAGFIYDLAFVPDELTANYFLFESRRGICTDFATASTLLLRAAGVPARYTEGYVLSPDSMDSYGRYRVTAAQAHAYATAYVEGYGWIEVDGTKYAVTESTEDKVRSVMIILVITAAVIAVLAVIFRRQLSELLFYVRFRFMNKSDRIRAVYLRTRKLACSIAGRDPKTATAEEVRDIISRALYMDTEVSAITDAANELMYGGRDHEIDADDMQLYQYYKTIRQAARKAQGRTRARLE